MEEGASIGNLEKKIEEAKEDLAKKKTGLIRACCLVSLTGLCCTWVRLGTRITSIDSDLTKAGLSLVAWPLVRECICLVLRELCRAYITHDKQLQYAAYYFHSLFTSLVGRFLVVSIQDPALLALVSVLAGFQEVFLRLTVGHRDAVFVWVIDAVWGCFGCRGREGEGKGEGEVSSCDDIIVGRNAACEEGEEGRGKNHPSSSEMCVDVFPPASSPGIDPDASLSVLGSVGGGNLNSTFCSAGGEQHTTQQGAEMENTVDNEGDPAAATDFPTASSESNINQKLESSKTSSKKNSASSKNQARGIGSRFTTATSTGSTSSRSLAVAEQWYFAEGMVENRLQYLLTEIVIEYVGIAMAPLLVLICSPARHVVNLGFTGDAVRLGAAFVESGGIGGVARVCLLFGIQFGVELYVDAFCCSVETRGVAGKGLEAISNDWKQFQKLYLTVFTSSSSKDQSWGKTMWFYQACSGGLGMFFFLQSFRVFGSGCEKKWSEFESGAQDLYVCNPKCLETMGHYGYYSELCQGSYGLGELGIARREPADAFFFTEGSD